MPGVRRIELAYNNIYLVSVGASRVLVDTGPDYAGAPAAIEAALGRDRPDRVIATHGHVDHAGLGRYWQARAVPVAVAPADHHLVTRTAGALLADIDACEAVARTSGAPADIEREALAVLGIRRELATLAATDHPPQPGRARWPTGLRFERFTPLIEANAGPAGAGLEVVPCPGHTPGNLVLHAPGEGWLFSGDQLLPEITPTPAIQSDPACPGQRFRSLPAFLASLERLDALRPTRCFPAHGDQFDGVATVIRANIDTIEQRTSRVLDELRAEGPATLYDLADRLYPRALRRRFWQIVPTVLGHLDLLADRDLAEAAGGLYAAR